jgi:serine/threonine-protein kinase
MDSEEIVRRFRTERQILAALDHPHIARLLDGGTTDRGLPFFVMDYVEGAPITRYCEDRRLATRERIELFRLVCAAVQFAHQNLVVHRDLKPANILITPDGTPKLLDFGIAKLLNPELAGATVMPTLLGWRPMTPDYASPEQIRGERITTASDVYSLGVLLYELLTGRSPHDGRPEDPLERARWICAHEPPRPSAAVRGREDGDRLRRALAGDLDTIVLKALRKEPAERYPSAEKLAEDLGRHLHGLPVQARRGTAAYRAAKLVRRHRLGAAVGAILVLALVAFGAGMGLRAAQLARERDRAEQQRLRAEQVTAFLVGLFEVSDPLRATGRTITAREILDAGAGKLSAELQDQPEVRTELQGMVGGIYRRLGLLDRAAALTEASLDGRRRWLGPEHPKVAESLNDLAIVHEDRGEYERAEALYRQALAMRRKLLGAEDPAVAQSLNDLACVLLARGEYGGAEDAFRDSLAMRRRLFGDAHPDVAKSLNNLAIVLWAQGRYPQAEEQFEEALALRRRFLGAEHVEVADALNNLALVVQAQGRGPEAETLYRDALAMRRKLLGEEHPRVADSLNNVGYVLQGQGGFAEAQGFHQEALALRRELLGDEHPDVAQSLFNLGVVAHGLGDLAAAEERHRESLTVRRRVLGADHPEVAASLDALGQVLLDAGRPAEAAELLTQALDLRRQKLGEDHPDTASTLANRSWARSALGDLAAAEADAREALARLRESTPEDAGRIAEAEASLGAALARGQGRGREAESLLEHSYETLRHTRGERAPTTRRALAGLVQSRSSVAVGPAAR